MKYSWGAIREETCVILVGSSLGKAKRMGWGQRLLHGKNWLSPLACVQPQRCYLQTIWGKCQHLQDPLWQALWQWLSADLELQTTDPLTVLHTTPSLSKSSIHQKVESSKHCVAQNRQTLRIPRCVDFYRLGKGPALHLRQFLKHPMHSEGTRGSCIIMIIITIIWNTCYSRDTQIMELFHVHKVTESSLQSGGEASPSIIQYMRTLQLKATWFGQIEKMAEQGYALKSVWL